ncbi:phosphate starvation-inducible protein PsiF [Rubrivivax gelatinosus]|nr:phosphate starvation-inducible protein PsiF [Rubrivivax gelatinosus]
MKKTTMVAALAALLACGPLLAAETAQQSKMKTCNAEAAGKKGDERKAFMKECLSAKPVKQTQQERMKSCNAEATGKTGDERKAFMKECLSNKASS